MRKNILGAESSRRRPALQAKIGRSMAASAAVFALAAISAPVWAHPGHDGGHGGFLAGLLHPLSGADHLLAMLAVGIWAVQLGGRARWAVPLSFVSAMALGAALAVDGIAPPGIDAGIAASLLALGLLLVRAGRLPLLAAIAMTGLFALFHGAAHGVEIPELAAPAEFAAGFLIATAALHGAGLLIGNALQRRVPAFARMAGAATALAGAVFLVG